MLRQGMRRMCTAIPGAEWYHVLPDVLRALRMLPGAVTGRSPFELVFKQHPRWTDRLKMTVAEPEFREPTAEEESALLTAQGSVWDELRGEVAAKQQKRDLQMVLEYQKKRRIASHDPRVVFKHGDRVLLRRR